MNSKSTPVSSKTIYFWNTLGGLLNAVFSVIIMMILTRLLNIYAAGIFSLGYSNAMMLQHIGSFDSRSYQCSCFEDDLKFGHFLNFRIFTSFLMLLGTIILIWFFQYPADKLFATLLLSVFCISANISDMFQGNAQKKERLDLSGKSLSYRIILCVLVFTVSLYLTRNLTFTLLCIVVTSFLWIFIYDVPVLSLHEQIYSSVSKAQFKKLFFNTFPLFLSLFAQIFIFNMPKYAIDSYLSVQEQGVYGIIFMPASIVSLFATFLYRPIMVKLSILWEKKKIKSVIKLSFERIALLIASTFLIVIAGYLLGTQILSILYGVDILPYKKELVILLIGGGFSGISVLLYYLITIVHKQKWMVVGYYLILVISYFVDYSFVKSFGLLGASFSYLFAVTLLDLILFLILGIVFCKRK